MNIEELITELERAQELAASMSAKSGSGSLWHRLVHGPFRTRAEKAAEAKVTAILKSTAPAVLDALKDFVGAEILNRKAIAHWRALPRKTEAEFEQLKVLGLEQGAKIERLQRRLADEIVECRAWESQFRKSQEGAS